MPDTSHKPIKALTTELLAGQASALARAISLVENRSPAGADLYQAVREHAGHARVIGITGPPGVGKSTLVNALASELRNRDKRVAVIAVDPSSPFTGGSILGDRTRMGAHTNDSGVFIRSLANRGHPGGLSASIFQVVDLVDAAGWETILLETVGSGQSDIRITDLAELNIVVNAPGAGDDIQASKAGILEIADILVVNKADLPLAKQTGRQLQAMLELRSKEHRQVPVLDTIATSHTGIVDLVDAIETRIQQHGNVERNQALIQHTRRMLAELAAQDIRQAILDDRHPSTIDILDRVAAGECKPDLAIKAILDERILNPWLPNKTSKTNN